MCKAYVRNCRMRWYQSHNLKTSGRRQGVLQIIIFWLLFICRSWWDSFSALQTRLRGSLLLWKQLVIWAAGTCCKISGRDGCYKVAGWSCRATCLSLKGAKPHPDPDLTLAIGRDRDLDQSRSWDLGRRWSRDREGRPGRRDRVT